jgi:hypothetical protein
MLKAVRVTVMLLVLVTTAYAGEALTPPAPQPPPLSAMQEPTTGGTTPDIMTGDESDSLTEIALGLLAVLPTLF